MNSQTIQRSMLRTLPYLFFFGLLTTLALGADSDTLDFEADLIQGERRMPDLFTQIAGPQRGLEGVLFMRNDFNDFHQYDHRWRPQFITEKEVVRK